ncbi:MAG: helix-turn-helix domain-containing protein [Maricaulaceae bacterium]
MMSAENKKDPQRAQLIVAAVTLEFGTPYMDVRSKTRGGSDICFARQISMYLMNVIYGVSLTRIGRAFNRDRSTASHACNVIEDYREDPLLDQKIS